MDPQLIECELITGRKKLVPAEELVFRPAVYALVHDELKLLLVNTKSTGKWFFPGGALEKGERADAALRREVREETGIELKSITFFTFKETFFYYEPHQQGYHSLNLFFLATPERTVSVQHEQADPTDEADAYAWMDVETLKPEDMQSVGGEILEAFRASLRDPRT